MTCTRCHGLLVEVPSLVWLSSNDYHPTQSDQCEGEAWQCLNCGNYIDAVILTNRHLPSQNPFEEEAAVAAAVNLVGGLMTRPGAEAMAGFTQPTTLRGREGIRSPVTDSTDHVSGFFPSEIEWSV